MGRRTYAAIDSGSESIVMDGWFARELGLALETTGHVTRDAAGRELAMWGARGVEIEVEGLGRLPSGLRAVTELGLERLGIGLILSPQFMAGNGRAVVLDFARQAIWFETEECAFAPDRFTGSDGASLPAMKACTDPAVATGYIHFPVASSVDGEPATLLLGTGAASGVVINTPSPIGERLLERHSTARSENFGAGGAFSCLKVPSKPVVVGELTTDVSVQVCERKKSDPKCVVDGVLGMKVLRSCTLAIPPRALQVPVPGPRQRTNGRPEMPPPCLPASLTWPGALYCLWAALAIGTSLWIGGTKSENLTRLMVLGFLTLTLLARRPLLRLFAPLRPRTRFVVMGCVLACVVEAFHMISKPVFDSLLVTRQTAWSQALLNLGIDLLFTLPAYVVVFGLVWFFINRYAYSLWGYVIVMGVAQALGDGGLFFFVGAPWMLAFLPYPMTNYHAINVLPFLAVREGLQPPKAKGGWLAIPAIVVAYFVCGALIQWVGRLAGLV